VDNLSFQKELEVIHSHLFEILGHIFQKTPLGYRFDASYSRGFITRFHNAASSRGFNT